MRLSANSLDFQDEIRSVLPTLGTIYTLVERLNNF